MKLTTGLFVLFLISVNFVMEAQVPTTGLTLWLKSSYGLSTTTDGASVAYWSDTSGHSYTVTQNTLAIRPTYIANAWNGIPAVKFDSSSLYTSVTDSALGIQNHEYEIFIVASTNDASGTQFLMSGSSIETYEMHLNGTVGARFIPDTSDYMSVGQSGDFCDGRPNYFDAYASGSGGKLSVSGSAGSTLTGNILSSISTNLTFGIRSDGTFPLYGDIFEILVYDTVLTSSDRAAVTSYLANKYETDKCYVNSTADADTGRGATGTLRYVLNRLNRLEPQDTAAIDMTGISGTITLTSALPSLNYDAILSGPGESNLTISGNYLYRPFFIGAGTSPFTENSPAAPVIELKDFTIAEGYAAGGAGYDGGGGGAGMGGAIFLNDGWLKIDSVAFDTNKVVGGTGGVDAYADYGGGGGFGSSGSGSSGGSGGLLGGTGGADVFNYSTGGNGGVGAGGGGGYYAGKGGFGGGSGGGQQSGASAGFGGGAGTKGYPLFGGGGYSGTVGGGGAGMGGAIFNRLGTLLIFNSKFTRNVAVRGSGGANDSKSFGGAVFNYGGSYAFNNVTYGSGSLSNTSLYSSNAYVYSGANATPVATVSAATNLTSSSATLNGNVTSYGQSTTYNFIYGTNPSSLSSSTTSKSAISSSTVSVSENLTGLTYGTFYYYKLIMSNSLGSDTSSIASFIYDTTISRTNLKMWLSADKGVYGSNGTVSEWFDRSGNNNNAEQSSISNKPVLHTNVINGKPVIRFDGTTSYMNLATASSIGLPSSSYEIFIVARTSSTDSGFVFGGTTGYYELQLNGYKGAMFGPWSGTNLYNGTSNEFADGNVHVFELMASTAGGVIRVDGTSGEYSLSNLRTTSTGQLYIGRRGNGANYFAGDIAEVIVYNSTLTNAERDTIAAYLNNKYSASYSTVSEPTVQTSNMTISSVTGNSLKITVTKGNGGYRIIVGKSGSAVDSSATDAIAYSADSVMGSGSQIGTGNYVLYSGSDSTVTVTGLSGNTTYYFSAYEYNGGAFGEDYFTSSPATASQLTNPSPPTFSTLADSVLSDTSIVFRGSVNPGGVSASYRFVYGTSASSFPDSTSLQNAGSGSSAINVRAELTGLSAGQIYYHKLIASNSGGTYESSIVADALNAYVTRQSLKVWLRADDGLSATTDSTSVSTWYDVSGNNNNASQSTSSDEPLFRTNIVNGNPVMRFNGSTSYLTLPSTGTIGIQSSDYEIFVAALTSSSSTEFLLSGTGYQYELQVNGSLGARFIPTTSTTYLDIGSNGDYANGNIHLFEVTASSTGGKIRVDGVDGGSSTSNIRDGNDKVLYLGKRSDNSLPFSGDIAEMLVYNTVLDTSARDTVESYLSGKYGISGIKSLPVELSTFTAGSSGDIVELKWNTASEVNCYGFDIQRKITKDLMANNIDSQSSIANRQWVKIGFVKGAGNSNSPKKYSFVDKDPAGGNNFEYRLKQVDNNGKFAYSKVVKVKLVPAKYELYQNYPNPFNPTTTIKYSIPYRSNVTLILYNILGQRVKMLVNKIQKAGYYKFQWNASKLASGVYICVLDAVSTNGQKNYQSIKKMVLLK